MKQSPAPGPAPSNNADSGGDPWAAFGYLVAGIVVYGGAGWGLSVWLHASYWIPIGILLGAGFGLYLVFARTLLRTGTSESVPSDPSALTKANRIDSVRPSDDAAHKTRPASDDRGETA